MSVKNIDFFPNKKLFLSMPIRKRILKWIGKLDVIQVEPFLAFGNGKEIFTKGRVISAYKQSLPSAKNNWLRNILASIRRYSVVGIPEVNVKISVGEHEYLAATNQDGVFEILIKDIDPEIQDIFFRILSEDEFSQIGKRKLKIDRIDSAVGVISDIDDTVLISHSTKIGKKFWLSISKNAYTRRPLPGVSEFYKKLTKEGEYPIFYVSSSDWSLFVMIKDFLFYRNIPLGPILLKDKQINLKNILKSGGGSHEHKKEKIFLLMRMFPTMAFYLIGDSGQHDPEIYEEILQEFPGRVKTIFIRIVNPSTQENSRRDRFEKIPNFHFIKNTDEAMEVARRYT
jgi:phosphatidate phosphatase APP1